MDQDSEATDPVLMGTIHCGDRKNMGGENSLMNNITANQVLFQR